MKKIDPLIILNKTSELTDQAADKAKDAIDATDGIAGSALNTARDGIETLREKIPETVAAAAQELRHLKCAGMDCARHARDTVKDNFDYASRYSVLYVKRNPGKSMLIAALSGAVVAALINCIIRSNSRDE